MMSRAEHADEEIKRTIEFAARGVAASFRRPRFLATRETVDQRSHIPPVGAGIYGWYFASMPPQVQAEDSVQIGGWWRRRMWLLYVGISNNLYRRIIKCHLTGIMPSSLRSKLQVMLNMRPHELSDWLDEHAAVFWQPLDGPSLPFSNIPPNMDPEYYLSVVENYVIRNHLDLPLNVVHNIRNMSSSL